MSKQRSNRDGHDVDVNSRGPSPDRAGAGPVLGQSLPKTTGQLGSWVQLRRDAIDTEESPVAAQTIAAAGTAGPSQALPHLDAIQRSFGRHDVSGVEAHVGGDAATASSALGAHAYASGNQVAFRQAPDLHLAAHEAAHVVQQRAGVYLKDGLGDSGDVYERHADRVADAVVSGKSAEGLLDQMAPSSSPSSSPSGGGSAAIQRDDDDEISMNDMWLGMTGTPMELAAFPNATQSQQAKIFKAANNQRRVQLLDTSITHQRRITLVKTVKAVPELFDLLWDFGANHGGWTTVRGLAPDFLANMFGEAPPAWTPHFFKELTQPQQMASFRALTPDMRRQVIWQSQHWQNRTVVPALLGSIADEEIKQSLSGSGAEWLSQLYDWAPAHLQVRLASVLPDKGFQEHVKKVQESLGAAGETAVKDVKLDLEYDDSAKAQTAEQVSHDVTRMSKALVSMPPGEWVAMELPERKAWFSSQNVLTQVTYLQLEPESKSALLRSIPSKEKRAEVMRRYLHTTKDSSIIIGMHQEDLIEMVQTLNLPTLLGEVLSYLSFRELYPLAPFLSPTILGRLFARGQDPSAAWFACSGLPWSVLAPAIQSMSDSEFLAFNAKLKPDQQAHLGKVIETAALAMPAPPET